MAELHENLFLVLEGCCFNLLDRLINVSISTDQLRCPCFSLAQPFFKQHFLVHLNLNSIAVISENMYLLQI